MRYLQLGAMDVVGCDGSVLGFGIGIGSGFGMVLGPGFGMVLGPGLGLGLGYAAKVPRAGRKAPRS